LNFRCSRAGDTERQPISDALEKPVAADWAPDCNAVVFGEEFSKERGKTDETRHEGSDPG
jgi:hypothetical protein